MDNPDREREPFTLSLSADEALVLFEFLARDADHDEARALEPGERAVMWRLEAQLESQLLAPLHPAYDDLLAHARDRLAVEEQ